MGLKQIKKTEESNMSAWSTGQPCRSVVLPHSADRMLCSAPGVMCVMVNSGPFSNRTSYIAAWVMLINVLKVVDSIISM